MKSKYLLLFTILAGLFLMSADNYNRSTVISNQSDTQVTYKTTFTMTDQTGNYYSKNIYIGDANKDDGFVVITVTDETGTEDIDFTWQYSMDGSTWLDQTASGGDDQLTTVGPGTFADTVGHADLNDDLYFHGFNLLRLKADGQTGNPAVTVTAYLTLRKEVNGARARKPQ